MDGLSPKMLCSFNKRGNDPPPACMQRNSLRVVRPISPELYAEIPNAAIENNLSIGDPICSGHVRYLRGKEGIVGSQNSQLRCVLPLAKNGRKKHSAVRTPLSGQRDAVIHHYGLDPTLVSTKASWCGGCRNAYCASSIREERDEVKDRGEAEENGPVPDPVAMEVEPVIEPIVVEVDRGSLEVDALNKLYDSSSAVAQRVFLHSRVVACQDGDMLVIHGARGPPRHYVYVQKPRDGNNLRSSKKQEKRRLRMIDHVLKKTCVDLSHLSDIKDVQDLGHLFSPDILIEIVSTSHLSTHMARKLFDILYECVPKGTIPTNKEVETLQRRLVSKTNSFTFQHKYQCTDKVDRNKKVTITTKQVSASTIDVSHLQGFILSFASTLEERKELKLVSGIPRDEMWIKIGSDKGGTSTKLTISFLNVDKPNSINYTLPLGFFSHDEDHAITEKVFKPLIDELFAMSNEDLPTYEEEADPFSFEDDHRRYECPTKGESCPGGLEVRCHSLKHIRRVKFFFSADLKFMNDLYGLGSHASAYSCLYCLRNTSTSNNDSVGMVTCKAGTPRDLRSIHDSYEGYNQAIQDAEGKRCDDVSVGDVLAVDYKNVTRKPLCPFEPHDWVAPSFLHIKLQIGKRLVDIVEEIANAIDKRSHAKHWSEYEAHAQRYVAEANVKAKLEMELRHFDQDDVALSRVQQDRTNKERRVELVNLIQKQNSVLRELETKMRATHGPCLKAVRTSLRLLNVRRQPPHLNGPFNGNDIIKIMRSFKSLLEPLLKHCSDEMRDEVTELYLYLENVFTSFAKIVELGSAARFLCDCEAKEYVKAIAGHRTYYTGLLLRLERYKYHNAKSATVSPELHILLDHSVEWMKRQKSIGVFEETPFERLHIDGNGKEQCYAYLTTLGMLEASMIRHLLKE